MGSRHNGLFSRSLKVHYGRFDCICRGCGKPQNEEKNPLNESPARDATGNPFTYRQNDAPERNLARHTGIRADTSVGEEGDEDSDDSHASRRPVFLHSPGREMDVYICLLQRRLATYIQLEWEKYKNIWIN